MMTTTQTTESSCVLRLSLHGRLVGHLLGHQNGRNILSFADSFQHDLMRPTFTLATHPNFPNVEKVLKNAWIKHHKLHPVLSNLLPEGVLRERLVKHLNIHIDHEFALLKYLGQDLPGALVATPLAPQNIPESLISEIGSFQSASNDVKHEPPFSLAGVQIKFSMKENNQRFSPSTHNQLGDWIVKPPSNRFPFVPTNEYTAMHLAKLAGIDIPEIRLVDWQQIVALPYDAEDGLNPSREHLAYAIKRFDRNGNVRIHTEDFAQVLGVYPHHKYDKANYEQIGRILNHFASLQCVQQFARRLLVNALLANGDAHLKNWSLIYPDQKHPKLSPAYDIVSTIIYMQNETTMALKLAKTKAWYTLNIEHFKHWSEKIGVSWASIQPHLNDTLDKARSLWPNALNTLPMDDAHKVKLRSHWQRMHDDFRID